MSVLSWTVVRTRVAVRSDAARTRSRFCRGSVEGAIWLIEVFGRRSSKHIVGRAMRNAVDVEVEARWILSSLHRDNATSCSNTLVCRGRMLLQKASETCVSLSARFNGVGLWGALGRTTVVFKIDSEIGS